MICTAYKNIFINTTQIFWNPESPLSLSVRCCLILNFTLYFSLQVLFDEFWWCMNNSTITGLIRIGLLNVWRSNIRRLGISTWITDGNSFLGTIFHYSALSQFLLIIGRSSTSHWNYFGARKRYKNLLFHLKVPRGVLAIYDLGAWWADLTLPYVLMSDTQTCSPTFSFGSCLAWWMVQVIFLFLNPFLSSFKWEFFI